MALSGVLWVGFEIIQNYLKLKRCSLTASAKIKTMESFPLHIFSFFVKIGSDVKP